jgi:LuxR family transcriptional regulator (chaperone HchA-associated)
MRAQDDRVLNSLLQLSGADSIEDVQAIVCRLAAPLGYDRVLFFATTTQSDPLVDRTYWVEGDWFGDGSLVDAETYLQRCPIARHILTAQGPFFWIKTAGQGYRVVRKPTGSGIKGFQVPVYGPIGLEGAASFGGVRIDTAPGTLLMLELLAVTAFRRCRHLLEGAAHALPRTLSKREREVLGWVASGRKHSEIAATLGISERTVENHLRNIRQRLGVKTTSQAVQAAIRLGELTLPQDE